MQIPFVGFQPVRTSEHMASAGVFLLINAYAILKYLQSVMSRSEFKYFFLMATIGVASVVFLGVVVLTYAGYVAPWSGRFYSLWDTGYARVHIPIIASVSEHQPTTWFSFFFDLHLLVPTFPIGLFYCIKQLNDERVFIALYAITASYFAGVMVRLMLTLAPVVCVLSAIAFSECFYYAHQSDTKSNSRHRHLASGDKSGNQVSDESDSDETSEKRNHKNLYDKAGKLRKIRSDSSKDLGLGQNIRSIIWFGLFAMLILFVVHCTWVTSNAYSSPSIVLSSYGSDG